MFVVKRPFRNYGKVYTAGEVVTDPAAIKRFKGKLAEGKIIEVTEQALEPTAKYFKEKHGVDIMPAKEQPKPKKDVAETVTEPKQAKKVTATATAK